MPQRLRERQFGTREDRDAFFYATRVTHKDVLRGTEQQDGVMVWWVMYGERKIEDLNPLVEAINAKIRQDNARTLTLEPPAAPAEPVTAITIPGATNELAEANTPETMSTQETIQDPSPR